MLQKVVTCGELCLRTAKNACKSVSAHSGGVFAFFDFVEKRKHPTPKGSVREPGSLTLPQVTLIEGVPPQQVSPAVGFACARQKMHARACQLILVGYVCFLA